jgi:hemolysin III
MDFLNPREPVSSWSHGVWLMMAVPGTVLLLRRSGGDRAKQLGFLIYGLSLVFCAAASTLYHGVHAPEQRIATFALLDYIAIYVLVAGSYTPIAWSILRGRWRKGILIMVWLWAASGSLLRLTWTTQPPWLSTGLYLSMGWGSVLCYFEVARRLSFRDMILIPLGGLLYSVGAIFNLMEQPVLWRGVFQAHELFHVFVVAASLVHFWFMLTVVVPFTDETGLSFRELDPDPRSATSTLGAPHSMS